MDAKKDIQSTGQTIPESASLQQEEILFEGHDTLHRRLGNRQLQLIAIGEFYRHSALYQHWISSCSWRSSQPLDRVHTLCLDPGLYQQLRSGDDCTVSGARRLHTTGCLNNILAVRAFGEAEFWLCSGKVLLLLMMFFFTFITMVGGNPQHDAYGFRNWNIAGAFAEHRTTGNLGKFEGFLTCVWSAAFTVVGPGYVALAAAETKRPRVFVKTAFKMVYWRYGFFFIFGALCVGIVVPWNDPTLQDILAGTSLKSGAAASPYVIAMANMGIGILPHFVTPLLLTSIFSAGNTLTYCASRSLYGLALDGRAPKLLARTTKKGVPIYAFAVTMAFPFLSFLQVSASTATVITWLISLVTAGALINYLVMCITYLRFYSACKAQELDRRSLPYYGYLQPLCAWVGIISMSVILLFYGYPAFAPWIVAAFFQSYTMQLVAPALYIGWKLLHKTRILKAKEIDLVWERPVIDAYEECCGVPIVGFWGEIGQLFRFKRPDAEGRHSIDFTNDDSDR